MALVVELANRDGSDSRLVADARGVGVNRALKAPRTARFTLGGGHRFRSLVRQAPRVIAKVYDVDADNARTLKHVGPLTGYRRRASGDEVTIELASTDAAWYLDRRLISVYNPDLLFFERGLLMKWAVDVAQGITPGEASWNGDIVHDPTFYIANPGVPIQVYTAPQLDAGVRARNVAATPTTLLETVEIQKISTHFATCSAGLDGPEWLIAPSEPTADAYGVSLGHLDIAPSLGTTRDNVAFEYGTGRRNVSDYEELLDPGTRANLVYMQTTTTSSYSADSPNMLLDGALQDFFQAGIPAGALANTLLSDHLAVRKTSRQIVTFTLAQDVDSSETDPARRRVPRAGIDYDVGDTVTFRAAENVAVPTLDGRAVGTVDEELVIDGTFRVYAIDESDDDNGARTTNLTVVAP